jgi:hypothetical protein
MDESEQAGWVLLRLVRRAPTPPTPGLQAIIELPYLWGSDRTASPYRVLVSAVGGRGQRRETLLGLIGPRLASRHSTSLKNAWHRACHACGATLTFIDVRGGSAPPILENCGRRAGCPPVHP